MAGDIKHIGLHAHRLLYDSYGSEMAFAKEWTALQPKPPMLPLLVKLIHREKSSITGIENYYPERLTQREAEVAATVVQWLGSPVGWCFLEQCIERCGYQLKKKKNG